MSTTIKYINEFEKEITAQQKSRLDKYTEQTFIDGILKRERFFWDQKLFDITVFVYPEEDLNQELSLLTEVNYGYAIAKDLQIVNGYTSWSLYMYKDGVLSDKSMESVTDPIYSNFINTAIGREVTNAQGQLELIEGDVLADVAQILTQLKNNDPDFYSLLGPLNLLPVFESQVVDFSSVNEEVDVSYLYYDNQDYRDYADFLLDYQKFFNANRAQIMVAEELQKKVILAWSFNKIELRVLSPVEKIELLSELVKDYMTNNVWSYFGFGPGYGRETLAVRLIKSVTAEQADEFLGLLISTRIEYVDISVISGRKVGSLYKALFYRLDDFGGPNNFTSFVNQINRLVLAQNEIVQTDDGYVVENITDINNLFSYNFIWNQKVNTNFVGEVNYSSLIQNDDSITFTESICTKVKIKKVEGQRPHTTITCIDDLKTEITLNHFDLISVTFISNPSFLDLCEYTDCRNESFITFAGYIDYLLEKKSTKEIFDNSILGLQVLSMAFGFGQFFAAVRAALFIRAFLGVYEVVGSVYAITINTDTFEEYLIEAYPNDWIEIKQRLNYFDIILGGTSISADIMYGAYRVNRAVEFLGEVDALLNNHSLIGAMTKADVDGLSIKRQRLFAELTVLRKNAASDYDVDYQIRTIRNVRNLGIDRARRGNAIETQAAVNRIIDARVSLGIPYPNRNFCFMDGVIPGRPNFFDDVIDPITDSKNFRSLQDQTVQADFDLLVSETAIQVFPSELAGSPTSWMRNVDSEYRNIQATIRLLKPEATATSVFEDVTGTVMIASERVYCPACVNSLKKFSNMFPNVDIILVDALKYTQ